MRRRRHLFWASATKPRLQSARCDAQAAAAIVAAVLCSAGSRRHSISRASEENESAACLFASIERRHGRPQASKSAGVDIRVCKRQRSIALDDDARRRPSADASGRCERPTVHVVIRSDDAIDVARASPVVAPRLQIVIVSFKVASPRCARVFFLFMKWRKVFLARCQTADDNVLWAHCRRSQGCAVAARRALSDHLPAGNNSGRASARAFCRLALAAKRRRRCRRRCSSIFVTQQQRLNRGYRHCESSRSCHMLLIKFGFGFAIVDRSRFLCSKRARAAACCRRERERKSGRRVAAAQTPENERLQRRCGQRWSVRAFTPNLCFLRDRRLSTLYNIEKQKYEIIALTVPKNRY